MSKFTQNSLQRVKFKLRLSLMDQKAQKPPKFIYDDKISNSCYSKV